MVGPVEVGPVGPAEVGPVGPAEVGPVGPAKVGPVRLGQDGPVGLGQKGPVGPDNLLGGRLRDANEEAFALVDAVPNGGVADILADSE